MLEIFFIVDSYVKQHKMSNNKGQAIQSYNILDF